MVGIQTCIREAFYPNFLPKSRRDCPKYSCDTNMKQCGKVRADVHGNDKKVILNDKVCKANEECPMSDISQYNFKDALCQKIQTKFTRYPGEDCLNIGDCVKGSACYEGKCTGQEKDMACSSTIECKTGLYCKDNKCVAQVYEGGVCSDTYDCKNNLVCYQNKCKK